MLKALLIFAACYALFVHLACFVLPKRLRKRQLRKRQAADMVNVGDR